MQYGKMKKRLKGMTAVVLAVGLVAFNVSASDETPEDPVVDETLVEPINEDPVVDETIVEPINEEPIVNDPVIEEPVKEEPVVEEPVKEEPVVEEPAKEEPVVVDESEKDETETEKETEKSDQDADTTKDETKTPEGTTPTETTPEETTPEETTPEETPAETPAETTPAEESQVADVPANINPDPTEEVEVSQEVITDNSSDAVYVERSYNPSEAFVSQGEKIKYSSSVPLENIPAFITQEMIVGALKCQDEDGFPASVTIAQIIQESGFGKYGPNGSSGQGLSYLAYQYNNLFGIKGTGPAGSVNMQTGEQTSTGESYTISAGFRVYNTYTESIEDRAKLLKEVYSDLIAGVTDANTFAMNIGGRWATDIQYSQSLIKQMETYNLYRLDKMTLNDFSELVGNFADPCPGSTFTSPFGWREWSGTFHKGIDLGTGSANIPTYAVQAGTVVTAGWNDSAGNWIIIDHGNGVVTKYMHHSQMYVSVGQQVQKGQQIGLSGTTGNSTGNHLHFQLEINGVAVDPVPYLWNENADTTVVEAATTDDSVTTEDVKAIFGEEKVLKNLEELIQE